MSVDYFGTFFTDEGFDFTGLVNADFFQPVRILFRNQHYVSATKLLVIAIDSISFVEFGDIKENTFIKWLNTYADLASVGITAEELWEHRNSLLHMSNLDSRKVLLGKVRRLASYIGQLHPDVKLNEEKTGYYDLQKLIYAIGNACGKWCETYGEQRDKIESFVERYDLIASDARMLRIDYNAK
ncbi:MAG: hypothetical protein L6302_06785 [Desulfobacteraceae bacterium]|nr:hypothetical protein [Desulfobacteraceae bacterium]